MKLRPNEVNLVGQWEYINEEVTADSTSRRIAWLIEVQLVRLASDASGWDTLYRDPADGRLWELTYPDSGAHGGGSPRLTYIDSVTALRKYGYSGTT